MLTKTCTKCNEEKPTTQFGKRNTKCGFVSHCKLCLSIYNKKRYAKNGSKKRKFFKQYRINNSICEICGIDDPNVIQIDHIDPSKKPKTSKNNRAVQSFRLCILKKDLQSDNTRNLCSNCHRKHTSNVYGYGQNKNKHIRRRYEYINNEKLKRGGCLDCGYNDFTCFSVFEFDHIDPNSKKFGISSLTRKRKEIFWSNIDSEMEKCELRCGNCHQIRTRKQRNTYLQKLDQSESECGPLNNT